MSGRGRGRGRGSVPPSVSAASLGGTLSSSHPAATVPPLVTRIEPKSRFPEMLLPDLPRAESFTAAETLAIEYSDRFDRMMQMSPFFRPIKGAQFKIDRYSDKYLGHLTATAEKCERMSAIVTDLSFFPEELHSVYVPERAKGSFTTTTATKSKSVSFKDTLSQIDEMAKREETETPGDGEAKPTDDDDEDEVVYDEDEFEDETDYNLSYFDNGEDGGGDYDGDGGEAVF